MSKTQDYKGLKPEQYQQLLIEKEQLAASRAEQSRSRSSKSSMRRTKKRSPSFVPARLIWMK
ncbi:MAG TPA: hypothetical protein VK609_17125 [Mucilaginibacter sp.]|nr:hypothetical protein [Mucilaginibacter sp.]